MKDKIQDLLVDVDVESIVKSTISKDRAKSQNKIDESFVAQQKNFKQVSELISQKTKDSHTELYKNYLKSFNEVSAKLDTVDRSNVNSRHNNFRSLKFDETYNLNAAWLHELYFANCFDPQSEIFMDSKAYMRLERDFGTFENWQKDFMACALGAGNGWAICGYNIFLRRFVNTLVSNHSQDVMVGLYPIIVVDMWEHSYFKDYTIDKLSYLVAQMREFNWNVIEERFIKAESINEVLK